MCNKANLRDLIAATDALIYLGGGSLYYSKYRVCLFKLLYNTRMRYLIQHLASVKHIMIPWCVYSYCEVGKGNGFCRSTSDLICDNRGIGTYVLSSLCLQISFHSYALVIQQTDYTQLHQVSLLAVISFIDQIISIKVVGEVLRNLAVLGVLKAYCLSSRFTDDTSYQFRAICFCRDFAPNLIINMPAHAPINT